MENNTITFDDKIGSSYEEVKILYPRNRKHDKSHQIERILGAIVILFCLVFAFLCASDIIPVEDILDKNFRKKNLLQKQILSNKSISSSQSSQSQQNEQKEQNPQKNEEKKKEKQNLKKNEDEKNKKKQNLEENSEKEKEMKEKLDKKKMKEIEERENLLKVQKEILDQVKKENKDKEDKEKNNKEEKNKEKQDEKGNNKNKVKEEKPKEKEKENSKDEKHEGKEKDKEALKEEKNKKKEALNDERPKEKNKGEKSKEKEEKSKDRKSELNEEKPKEKKFSNGNIGLNPNYERIDPNHTKYTYIPVVGIDDVHGLFFPKVNKIKIGNKTLVYKTGGLEFITKYINILREEFGAHRVLFFDGGDFYQGGIDSVLFDGEIMYEFYNLLGVNGSTIGNHEFDYSKSWIESKYNKGNFHILINNIMDNSTKRKNGILGKNHRTSQLYEIKLGNGDIIKIGVIGLSFNMKNDKKMPNTWGNRATWDNITFFNYIEGLEEESNKLRKKGAVAIIGLTHFGIVCNQTESMKLNMYTKNTKQSACFREDDDSVLYKLLDSLKPGILDGIIGGDTHMEMHHWENNIPMMSTPTHARYINVMYLPFKKGENGKYTLINDEIKIEGPIPACEKIFKNYQNCELISSKEYERAGELIDYSWHGIKIEKDSMVLPIYKKYYQKYKEYAEQDIVTFEGFDKERVDKSGDCILCNTYLDAIVGIKKADFAIINRGIFPEELVPGTLSRAEFYNQMPYLDRICTVNVTGEELKKIVSTVQSFGKAFYPSSNLKVTVKIDKTGKKTVENIEIYINGVPTKIDDSKIYKMA
jgi:2',3'-cyclic-nucleotide 2'-phosphodiesterase (5'-nucleotidase family)